MKKLLTLLPMLALVFLDRAGAIGITLEGGLNLGQSTAGIQYGAYAQDTQALPTTGEPYSVTTSASLNANLSANNMSSYANSANQAVFTGSTTLIDRDPTTTSYANSGSNVYFTLSEQADYAITGNIIYGDQGPAEPNQMGSIGFSLYSVANNQALYSVGYVALEAPGSFALPTTGAYGQSTGSLGPGQYYFVYSSWVTNGVVNTDFALTLSTTPPPDNGGGNTVPDSGSTLMLLGMAFSAIGVARSKLSK